MSTYVAMVASVDILPRCAFFEFMEINYSPAILRAARALLGLEARQFAALAKVSRPTLRNAETGEKKVSLETIERIQKTYEELGVEFTRPGPDYGSGLRWRVPNGIG